MVKGLWNSLCRYFLDAMPRININRSSINKIICPAKKKKPKKPTSKTIKSLPAYYIYQIMCNNDSLYNGSIKLCLKFLSVKIHLGFFTYRRQRKTSRDSPTAGCDRNICLPMPVNNKKRK